MQIEDQQDRIAKLEAVLKEAKEALTYHTAQTRPIERTTEALSKIEELGL